MRVAASRWARACGTRVEWGNVIGGYMGQSGSYTFVSTEDAEAFAAYARRADFPALSDEALRAAGVPLPARRDRDEVGR